VQLLIATRKKVMQQRQLESPSVRTQWRDLILPPLLSF
jgi:hypothetical protein